MLCEMLSYALTRAGFDCETFHAGDDALEALRAAPAAADRPVVLLGGFWQGFIDEVETLGLVERSQLAVTHVVGTPEDAVAVIRRAIG